MIIPRRKSPSTPNYYLLILNLFHLRSFSLFFFSLFFFSLFYHFCSNSLIYFFSPSQLQCSFWKSSQLKSFFLFIVNSFICVCLLPYKPTDSVSKIGFSSFSSNLRSKV
ncbi:unnamed protein product [Acanthoscelides obtectus]|uniref:Uncharacterized protein n=1 Tax=Acanthoscelides obtectus TaxID=200917 RepID=A0A9P0PBQ1_ACAOB|nr:unnamed protein product [Acanthoscelides obtectus]CAK1648192.1 hypothetical protein AOBTE_LOCUS15594 [Acanthoscelides obtectus]